MIGKPTTTPQVEQALKDAGITMSEPLMIGEGLIMREGKLCIDRDWILRLVYPDSDQYQ